MHAELCGSISLFVSMILLKWLGLHSQSHEMFEYLYSG